MVKLRIDSSFYGIPRLPFVFIIGISLFILIILYFICFCLGFICAGILGLGMACYVACRKKNEYGLISQQSFYEDFKYDLTVDSKEREIFRTPLSKYFLTINLLFPAVIDFYYSSFEITIIFHINNYFLTQKNLSCGLTMMKTMRTKKRRKIQITRKMPLIRKLMKKLY